MQGKTISSFDYFLDLFSDLKIDSNPLGYRKITKVFFFFQKVGAEHFTSCLLDLSKV